jgi:hypothetical protein
VVIARDRQGTAVGEPAARARLNNWRGRMVLNAFTT